MSPLLSFPWAVHDPPVVGMNGAAQLTTEKLPEVLAMVAGIAGRDAALCLAKKYGGGRKYIPKIMLEDHPIALTIGHEAAVQLSNMYGGERIVIPLGPMSYQSVMAASIAEMLAEGSSKSDISRTLHVSKNTVDRHRKKLGLTQNDDNVVSFPACHSAKGRA